MKYGELTWGQMEAIVNKLGGMEGVRRLLSGDLVVKEKERQFKIWKTITLGLHTSTEYYKILNKDYKGLPGRYLNWILRKILISQEVMEVDLVIITGQEMGFEESVSRTAICDRAIELGLQKCPDEVGPALRNQYLDQPYGEWLVIGMDPITYHNGGLYLLSVGSNISGLWFILEHGHPNCIWNPDTKWVFILPRK